jgi:pimeloyl-ACP methyl ester carboxylesterase
VQKTLQGAGYNSIAYDMRGHGESTKCDCIDYSPSRLVMDAVEVARTLRACCPIVGGVSMGGMIAIAWAGGVMPGLPPISRLMLFDTSPSPLNTLKFVPIWPNIGLSMKCIKDVKQGRIVEVTYNDLCDKDAAYYKLLTDMTAINDQCKSDLLYKLVPHVFESELVNYLPNIRVPTLIVHGTLDRVFNFDAAVFMYMKIPDAHLVGVPNRGHNAVVTDSVGVCHSILNFLGNKCDACVVK